MLIFYVENPPAISYIKNTQQVNDVLRLGYKYQLKITGAKQAQFIFIKGCSVSISVATTQNEGKNIVSEPFVVKNLNLKHEQCKAMTQQEIDGKIFLTLCKEAVGINRMMTVLQIYETKQNDYLDKGGDLDALKDFDQEKWLLYFARSNNFEPQADRIIDAIVRNQNTNSKQKFLIYDYMKFIRIRLFASPLGLKMLSENIKWHVGGTCHTATRYFGQLYTIHAYFHRKEFDPKVEQVWRKRMIPAVWVISKRRRVKNYTQIFHGIKNEAQNLGYVLEPKTIMVDFEREAMIAFQNEFLDVEMKGCIFHFGQSLHTITPQS
jgi:hypothetical protein